MKAQRWSKFSVRSRVNLSVKIAKEEKNSATKISKRNFWGELHAWVGNLYYWGFVGGIEWELFSIENRKWDVKVVKTTDDVGGNCFEIYFPIERNQ